MENSLIKTIFSNIEYLKQPPKKELMFEDEFKDNIDLLVVGVSSKGIEWIGGEISKFYKSSMDILLLTKGLAVINNQFETLAEKLNKILMKKGINDSKISIKFKIFQSSIF